MSKAELPFRWAEAEPPGEQDLRRREGVWYKRLEPLLTHQGKWGVFSFPTRQKAKTCASQLRRRYFNIPREDYEWEIRTVECELYVRFRGGYLPESERKKIARYRELKRKKERAYHRREGED